MFVNVLLPGAIRVLCGLKNRKNTPLKQEPGTLTKLLKPAESIPSCYPSVTGGYFYLITVGLFYIHPGLGLDNILARKPRVCCLGITSR